MTLPLFDIPHSRTKDPITSYEAADGHLTMESNRQKVKEALQRHSGFTARELAGVLGMEYHEVYRRLADLKNLGQAEHGEQRRCRIADKKCVTWKSK